MTKCVRINQISEKQYTRERINRNRRDTSKILSKILSKIDLKNKNEELSKIKYPKRMKLSFTDKYTEKQLVKSSTSWRD